MTLLITGITGFLGHRLAILAKDRYTVFGTFLTHTPIPKPNIRTLRLDIRDRTRVLATVKKLTPTTIIHTAALNTGNDAGAFHAVNTLGSAHVAEAATTVGAKLIHLSTDTVHSGRDGPYTDDANPAPVNRYGESKAAAEDLVSRQAPGATLVRTSLIYDMRSMPRSTRVFTDALKNDNPVFLFRDVVRQPIWLDTLANALLKLVERGYSGSINIAGRQAVTREHYERTLLRRWKTDDEHLIQPVCAAEKYPTVPLDLRLSVKKAETLLNIQLCGFDEIMRRYNR